jgi:hypothetical protein
VGLSVGIAVGVDVGGNGVSVGVDADLGGIGIAAGGTGVAVGRSGVCMAATATWVAVAGTGVAVGSAVTQLTTRISVSSKSPSLAMVDLDWPIGTFLSPVRMRAAKYPGSPATSFVIQRAKSYSCVGTTQRKPIKWL